MSQGLISLAELAARYQTLVSEAVFDGISPRRIADNNPKRIFIRFTNGQGAGGSQSILPAPSHASLNASTLANVPAEFAYKDCPSLVTGEWFGFGAVGTSVFVIECVHNGG